MHHVMTQNVLQQKKNDHVKEKWTMPVLFCTAFARRSFSQDDGKFSLNRKNDCLEETNCRKKVSGETSLQWSYQNGHVVCVGTSHRDVQVSIRGCQEIFVFLS